MAAAIGCAASPSVTRSESCWVEYSAGDAPASLAAAGVTASIWHTTTSGLLIRHPRGHVLVDAGWSHAVAEETGELTDAGRPISTRIMNSVAWRKWTPAALALP